MIELDHRAETLARELTAAEFAALQDCVDAAAQQQDSQIEAALNDALAMVPRLLRGPLKKLLLS